MAIFLGLYRKCQEFSTSQNNETWAVGTGSTYDVPKQIPVTRPCAKILMTGNSQT